MFITVLTTYGNIDCRYNLKTSFTAQGDIVYYLFLTIEKTKYDVTKNNPTILILKAIIGILNFQLICFLLYALTFYQQIFYDVHKFSTYYINGLNAFL